MDNNLRLLGIARKAGLLAVGDESVGAAARSNKLRAVFSASDASEGSKQRARRSAENYGAVYLVLPYTKLELGTVTGRGSPGIIAIMDTGLASGFVKGLAASNPAVYGETAELLSNRAQKALRRKRETSGNLGGKRRTVQ